MIFLECRITRLFLNHMECININVFLDFVFTQFWTETYSLLECLRHEHSMIKISAFSWPFIDPDWSSSARLTFLKLGTNNKLTDYSGCKFESIYLFSVDLWMKSDLFYCICGQVYFIYLSRQNDNNIQENKGNHTKRAHLYTHHSVPYAH